MSVEELNQMLHEIVKITEAIRLENNRHSQRIMSLDIELANLKVKMQAILGNM